MNYSCISLLDSGGEVKNDASVIFDFATAIEKGYALFYYHYIPHFCYYSAKACNIKHETVKDKTSRKNVT